MGDYYAQGRHVYLTSNYLTGPWICQAVKISAGDPGAGKPQLSSSITSTQSFPGPEDGGVNSVRF